jgi:hypothetical protein
MVAIAIAIAVAIAIAIGKKWHDMWEPAHPTLGANKGYASKTIFFTIKNIPSLLATSHVAAVSDEVNDSMTLLDRKQLPCSEHLEILAISVVLPVLESRQTW